MVAHYAQLMDAVWGKDVALKALADDAKLETALSQRPTICRRHASLAS
ncbi:MAG: hypothetical protein M5U09_02745 [Gammaproteobacteria bacterium]|nr:hypothetical protein [Gammaproteobacteria bacterium]